MPAASGLRTILSLATQLDMFTDHVDISQAFVQGELLPGDGHNGKVYCENGVDRFAKEALVQSENYLAR